MRAVTLGATIALALLVALGGAARARECPPPDAFNDSTVPGCPSNVVDPSAPIDDGIPPMAPPTVDVNGDPIPSVDEITAPPPAPTLTAADPD